MAIPSSPLDESRLRDDTLSTGVTVLDTEILQGIPAGSTVAILGDPRGMAELFLAHLVHTDRQTHYVSTVRPERQVFDTLETVGDVDPSKLNIEDIYSTSDEYDAIIKKHADRVNTGHNLIVDTFTNAYDEDAPERYLQTLKNVYQRVASNDALAYLYFANNDLDTMERAEREAVHMCDVVFNITTEPAGDSIDTRLEILKMRGHDLPDEQIKLNVGGKLTVDTTRDIA
jgi:KaiC/GvpD/RAD55 family RecA-like ATPase